MRLKPSFTSKARLPVFLATLGIFTALVQGLAIADAKGLIHLGPPAKTLRLLLLMWSPAFAALATCRMTGRSIRSLGWAWGSGGAQWAAYLIPLGYSAFEYAVIWTSGMGHFPDPDFAARVAAMFGLPARHTGAALAIFGACVLTLYLLGDFHLALGEEIGWRGFLLPELMRSMSPKSATLVVGGIWFAWHLPSILWLGYGNGATLPFTLGVFFIGVMSASVIATRLRIASGGVWAPALFHVAHNTFLQGFFDPLTKTSGTTGPYVIGEFGLPVTCALAVVAALAWRGLGAAVAPTGGAAVLSAEGASHA